MANVLGLITINGKEILEVDAEPGATTGTAAPIGSLALFDNGVLGSLWIKSGAADTAWQSFDIPEGQDWEVFGNDLTGGAPATPDQWFGSKNDYDVVYKRNNVELMRLVSDGLLVGLSASLGGRLQVKGSALGADLFKQISPNGGVGTAEVIHVTRQYKVQTIDATPVVLASVLVPQERRIQSNFMISCWQSNSVAGNIGDGCSYERTIDAKRLATGDAVLAKYQTDFTSEDVGVKNFNVTAAVSTNNIELSVKGDTDKTVSWMGHMQMLIVGE